MTPLTPRQRAEKVLDNLMETLAACEHDRWARWLLHSVGHLSEQNIARWTLLSNTDYKDLSEELKEKDRQEVRLYAKPLAVAMASAIEQAEREAYAKGVNDMAGQAAEFCWDPENREKCFALAESLLPTPEPRKA